MGSKKMFEVSKLFAFRKKKDGAWVDLKNQPVPEGAHLLEVDNLKM